MPPARSIFRLLPFLGVAVLAVMLVGCPNQWSWHEKITVKVETPNGERAASSVIRKTLIHTDGWLAPREARGASESVWGEAVVLEVAPGKYLFALLKGLPSPFEVFFPGEAPVEVASRMKRLRGHRTLSSDLYPLLVTFDDIADPTTVRQVDPSDLASVFGPGYTLNSITLEITDEKVTEGKVENLLVWLTWSRDKLLATGNGRSPLQISYKGGVLALGRTDFRTK